MRARWTVSRVEPAPLPRTPKKTMTTMMKHLLSVFILSGFRGLLFRSVLLGLGLLIGRLIENATFLY